MTYEELEQNVIKHFNSDQYNCAESVLKALLEYFELEFSEDDVRVFSGFGGGIGGCGCLCGTITGATAILGHIFKNEKVNDKIIVSRALAAKVHKYFTETYKDPCCRIITQEVPKKDKKAKVAFCTPINADMVVFTAKLVEDYKTGKILL